MQLRYGLRKFVVGAFDIIIAMTKQLSVSIVVPAFNEGEALRECLEAIQKQAVRPFEVIVVDNNSKDDTVAIAQSFPFVRVIRETRQGVVFAREAGFDAARGAIIGRIDADTIIPPNWVQTVREIFAESEVAAVSGKMLYDDVALKDTVNTIELFFRRWLARSFTRTNTVFLQGASMAVRRDAWRAVRPNLCQRTDIHEDYDIALHLQQHGYTVHFDERLVAQISLRRMDTSFRDLLAYVLVNPRSYRVHNAPGQLHMYAIISLVLVAYFPLRLLYRGYDKQTQSFRFGKIFEPSSARISPVGTDRVA